MGYSTYFDGEIIITPALDPAVVTKWNEDAAQGEGALPPTVTYKGQTYAAGQHWGGSCDWELVNSGVLAPESTLIQHNGGEKFYDYVEWMEYLHAWLQSLYPDPVRTFEGQLEWQGEESNDIGCIRIVDDTVIQIRGRKVYD